VITIRHSRETEDRRIKRLYQREYHQAYHLPKQLARARHRVAQLEQKARVYGMNELLENPDLVNECFEREVAEAKRKAGL
jgi:hypothetical protein